MSRKTVALAAAVVLLVVAGWLVLRPVATERMDEGLALAALMRDLGVVPVSGPAKAFVLPSLDGRPVKLSDVKGRPVLIYFWATW